MPSALPQLDGASCSAPSPCAPRMLTSSSRQPASCTTSSLSRTRTHKRTWTVRIGLATLLQDAGAKTFRGCKGMMPCSTSSPWSRRTQGTSPVMLQKFGICLHPTSAALLVRFLGSGLSWESPGRKPWEACKHSCCSHSTDKGECLHHHIICTANEESALSFL